MDKKRTIYLILLLVSLLMAGACGQYFSSNGTSLVTISIGEDMSTSLHAEENTLLSRLPQYLKDPFTSPAQAAIPSEVVSIRLTIDGPDMETIVATFDVTGQTNVTILVEVPNGPGRHFFIECLDANGSVVYSGETIVDLDGSPVTIPIAMVTVIYDTSPPTVISTSPASGATGIPISTNITTTFSEPMDDTTISTSTVLLSDADGIAVSGTVTYNPNQNSATFMPDADLVLNMQYTVTITTGVSDFAGNAMAADHTWSFTTERAPDDIAPTITGTTPAAGASNIPRNTSVTATFSEEMDPATINTSTFTVTGATGAVSYNPANNSATFTPAPYFSYNTSYTATVTTGATDLSGNPLAVNHTWTFRTEQQPPPPADTNPPVFGGLGDFSVLTFTSVQLFWSPASDDRTLPSNMVYYIYMATSSGGQNFATPSFSTPPGATSYTVTNLTPGTSYYFVVRARDEAGNTDTNVIEGAAIAQGRYVDVASGIDQTGCGTQVSPCKTISWALQDSPGYEGIFVAAGTYNEAFEFNVPFQLKPGTGLFCLGPGYSTIINTDFFSADAFWGNTGAIVDGCMILPGCDQTGIVDKIGGPTGTPAPMTINNVIINEASAGCGPLDNIILSADSTVTNSQIRNSTWHGISIESGNPTISGNTIIGHSEGINISGGSPVISGNTFSADTTGIIVQTASAQITGNTLDTNIGTGIDISTGTAMIQGNTITNNSDAIGIRVTAGSPTIDGNTIENNTPITGILINAGSAAVQNNIIQNNVGGAGISIGGGTPTIGTGNTIIANDTGIYISGGDPVIDGNTIKSNTGTGVTISFAAVPGNPAINNNSIYCNTIQDMYLFNTGTIDATSNTWDHAPPSSMMATCTIGIDICYVNSGDIPNFTPYNTVPGDACP